MKTEKQMQQKPIDPQSGFTLVELAIVILIIGILLIPLTQLYESYMRQQKLDVTADHIIQLNALIGSVRGAYYNRDAADPSKNEDPHYPCPSDRALAPNAPAYLKPFNSGNCTLKALKNIGLDYALATNINPVCTPNFGFCIAVGSPGKDFDGDGKPDPIFIGGIPIIDIGKLASDHENGTVVYPRDLILDGWGNQITYAVSANLVNTFAQGNTLVTNPTTGETVNRNDHGVISVVDENGSPTAGINKDGHYVLISHGVDGSGAFTSQGGTVKQCGIIAQAKDNDNCNNDYQFVSAIGVYSTNGASHFDDYLFAYKQSDTGIWDNLYDGQNSIRNLNMKNIGVGTDSPLTKLDVAGTLKGDYNALAGQLCKESGDKDGKFCFDIKAITGDVIKCGANKVMAGVSQGTALPCNTAPASATKATVKTCPAGQFIHGINLSTGEPLCAP